MPGRTFVAAAVLGATCLLVLPLGVRATPSWARPADCPQTGYGYAGLATVRAVRGIAGTVTAVRAPQVASGHAAAWVGVGEGRGRGWLQVGIAAFPGRPLRLYTEHVSPGGRRTYDEFGPARVGTSYALAVVEAAGRPGWWQAYLDGRRAGPPVRLSGGAGERAVATAESWVASGQPCNTLAYRFRHLRVTPGRSWRPFARGTLVRTSGFTLASEAPASFLAARRAG